jgi:hypothetical protein
MGAVSGRTIKEPRPGTSTKPGLNSGHFMNDPRNADQNHGFQLERPQIKTARVRGSHSQAALEHVLPDTPNVLRPSHRMSHLYVRPR